MENSAQRRLQSIARHLISPETIARDLNPNLSSAEDSSPAPVVIIGGMVLDVHAKPYEGEDAIPGTTAPGVVKLIRGGVARNVAECMSKLGSKPFIVSVVGTDAAGAILLEYWKSARLFTEGILKIPGVTTPAVSNTFDSRGELAAGVASVEAVEKFMTPNIIWKFRHAIHNAPVLMVDANLSPQSLEAASKTLPASVVSLTGAGDCLVGGILASICSGLDLVKSLAVGIAVAKVTVESENNVPAEFSLSEVTDEAWKIFSSARQLVLD